MLRPPAIVLAGGLSTRMPGGKCFSPLAGKPMLTHVLERLATQTDRIAISANGNAERLARFGLPILPDVVGDYPGPLAGILSGMLYARENWPDATHIVSVSCDVPFLPRHFVQRLVSARAGGSNDLVVACSYGVVHPVLALWPVTAAPHLLQALRAGTARSVTGWIERSNTRVGFADFTAADGDPFLNINTPQDLARANARRGQKETGYAFA